jgi:5'(3')-deoxyribonucleotidase
MTWTLPGKTIYMDMDGVASDFARGLLRAHGYDVEKVLAAWPINEYDAAKVLGLTYPQLWYPVNLKGARFWRGLAEYPHFKELYARLQEIAPVVFLTSPSWDPESAQGKIDWLQDRFGRDFREFIITNRKHLLARPNALLIDDDPRNTMMFSGAGGLALTFPMPFCPRNFPENVVDLMVNAVQERMAGL